MSTAGAAIISEIRRIVADYPDHVYQKPVAKSYRSPALDPHEPGCVYVHDGKPSCLIGKALWDLGYIDSLLEGTGNNFCSSYALIDELSIGLDLGESNWISQVQVMQDMGHSWRRCVEHADWETPGL